MWEWILEVVGWIVGARKRKGGRIAMLKVDSGWLYAFFA